MAPRPSPQTERLVAVVDAIAERPEEGLTLSEIARHLGVSPATCHPMLASLTSLGWLIRHPVRRTYRLGPALIVAGRAATRGLGVLDLALPVMRRLRDDLGLTVLALSPGHSSVTVAGMARAPSAGEPQMRIGDQIPITPPFGAGYVCWADERTVRRWVDGAAPDAASRRGLREAVLAARARGYTVEPVTPIETELAQALEQLDARLEGAAAARLRTLIERLTEELPAAPGDTWIRGLDPDAGYPVGRIAAPVMTPSGEPALILAVHGFPRPVDGTAVLATGGRLVTATREISKLLGGT